MKQLKGRDANLVDEFFMLEADQSEELGMARAHLEDTSKKMKQYREVLEQIAAMPRKTRGQRLASSCLHFVDALQSEKGKIPLDAHR